MINYFIIQAQTRVNSLLAFYRAFIKPLESNLRLGNLESASAYNEIVRAMLETTTAREQLGADEI